MQWNDSDNAGFSKTKPWLPVPPSYKTHNVPPKTKIPIRSLNVYRHLLALRHSDAALLDGEYVPLNESDPNVLSYLRRYKKEAVLVVLNMSSSPQTANFNLKKQGLGKAKATTLLTTMKEAPTDRTKVSLEPFGVYIAKLSK